MIDAKGITFDDSKHKTKNDGTPWMVRGIFVTDSTKTTPKPAKLETTEFTRDDIPDRALEAMSNAGVNFKFEEHLIWLQKGIIRTCINMENPEPAFVSAVIHFCASVKFKGDVGKAEKEKGF